MEYWVVIAYLLFYQIDVMEHLTLDVSKDLLKVIGLLSPKHHFYRKIRKFAQMQAYAEQLSSVITKLTTKRPPVLLDAACGRAYVSFYLYAYCTEVLGRC